MRQDLNVDEMLIQAEDGNVHVDSVIPKMKLKSSRESYHLETVLSLARLILYHDKL